MLLLVLVDVGQMRLTIFFLSKKDSAVKWLYFFFFPVQHHFQEGHYSFIGSAVESFEQVVFFKTMK